MTAVILVIIRDVPISYLWYNVIAAVVVLVVGIALGGGSATKEGSAP